MERVQIYPEFPKRKRMRKRNIQKRQAGRLLKNAAREAADRLPLAGCFFLLSLANCFSVPSPFAVCALAALLDAGAQPKGVYLGLSLGLACRLLWGLRGDEGQFIACLLVYPLMQLWGRRDWQLLALTAGLLLLQGLLGLAAAGWDGQAAVLHGASLALGLGVLPAFRRAARLLTQRKPKISQDELLCLALPALLLLTGAARLSLFQVNAGYFAAVFCGLTLSWLCGGAWGVCLGLGCGLSLLAGGQSALLLVNLTFGAMTAGLFQGRNRLLTAGVYWLCSFASTYLIARTFYPFLLLAEGGAGLAFCLVPGPWLGSLGRQARALRWSEPRENAYTRLRMEQWAQAVERMAQALPAPRIAPATAAEECDTLTAALCAECERLPICWHEQADQTREGMAALAARGEPGDSYLEIINRYFSQCPRIARLPDLLDRLDGERQKRQRQALCADYEREMLQTHLTALAQAVGRMGVENQSGGEEEQVWFQQAEAALQSLRFPGHTAFVKRVEGRLLVCLQCDPLALPPAQGQDIASQLSLQLGARLIVTGMARGRVLLEEEPPLAVVTGMATACAVSRDAARWTDRRPDNGDAVLAQSLPGGRQLLALSDGMGHGADAREESRKTLELMALCLEAGYSRGQAMTAVNGAMLSATAGEKFATVDLCVVDQWTGETAMNKLGACASFLIQGQKIHTVEGAALPLGILEHVTPMEHTFTLGEGDTLLLVSDGVTDAFSEEGALLSVLQRLRAEMPQPLAEGLLREALMQQNGLPQDDMTVLCARLAPRRK